MPVSFISENFLALVGNSIIENEVFNYSMAFFWHMHTNINFIFPLQQQRSYTNSRENKMPCYRKDDRSMPLFHPNFVHAYDHYTLRIFDSERI